MKSALNPRGSAGSTSAGPAAGEGTELGAIPPIVELRHPHLVVMRPLPDRVGFEPDLAGGELLSQLCRRKYGVRPIPLRFGLRILLDVLSGLAALHGAKKNGRPLGFSHGEIAPCNIVVGRDGLARLIPIVNAHWDKVAPANQEATGYAAPEKLRGDPFDQRADTFSAGVMLWEMITGRSFRGLPAEIITAWVVDGMVPNPLQPEDAPWVVSLATVATTALAVDPAKRWSPVGLMGAEIEAIVDDHMASASEVARLLVDGEEMPRREPVPTPPPVPSLLPTPPAAPSLLPTAMSIPPAPVSVSPSPEQASHARNRDTLSYEHAPASAVPFQISPPVDESRSASPRRPMGRKMRNHPLIAWSTMGVALVLLLIAAHELFSNPSAGPAASAPPVSSALPAVTSKVTPPPESTDRSSPPLGATAASKPSDPARWEAMPLPSASASPAGAPPSAQPGARPAPHRKTAPPPVRKGSKRDDQFGI